MEYEKVITLPDGSKIYSYPTAYDMCMTDGKYDREKFMKYAEIQRERLRKYKEKDSKKP
jgi:hypothetical protein